MSSSGSWSGGGAGARPADIIDLDRFMRGGVRPPRQTPSLRQLCDRLVVDNGGPSLKANASSSRESTSVGRLAPPPARGKHQKRFSHDSGLSDGSYTRRRHRHHRRPGASVQRSSGSLRAFRAACERALLDQQRQIARVAHLCEQLTVQRAEKGQLPPPATTTTSDISSSSRSTADQRRKDKHRTQECKTYKIIMNKLDELNRLFAAGGRSPPRPRPRRAPSSASVTVSDKLVATEPEPRGAARQPNASSLPDRRVVEKQTPQLVERAVGSISGSVRDSLGRSSARSPRVVVTKAYAFDISPREALNARHLLKRERPNVVTESIVKDDYLDDEPHSSKCDPRCGFDLDDPVHLYSQAKRLQALHASTRRRTHSADGAPFLTEYDERERENERERIGRRTRETSLCALCRCYWRSLRHFLAGQLFCCPDDNYKYS